MPKESTNLADFHRELNSSNLVYAYEIALFLKEKYIDLGGPHLALNYLNRFIEEYEINLKDLQKKEKVKNKKNSISLLKWNKISELLPLDISQSCEKACRFLSSDTKYHSISKIIFKDWTNFIFSKNKYVEFFDGWYSSTHSISLRIKIIIPQENFLEILQPSYTNHGYLESLKLIAINRNELFLDINLNNPFLPLYFIFYTDRDKLSKVLFLPFPSLLRNGIHYCELLFNKNNLDLKNAITYYSYELINNINLSNHNEIQSEDQNELVFDNSFLENYDIFNFFDSLNINCNDLNVLDKNLDSSKDIFPSLKILSNFKYNNQENIVDYTLFINKFNFTPLFILCQPNQNFIKNKIKKGLINFRIKGLGFSEENGLDNLESTNQYLDFLKDNDKSINEFHDFNLNNKNNNNQSCTVVINDIFCEHKLLILIESLIEQKNIEINEIILLESTLSSDKIRNVIEKFENYKEIILIYDFEEFQNLLANINATKVKDIIFISSLVKLNFNYTLSFLIHNLKKSKDVSNISCGINTSTNYIGGEINKKNKYGLQINLPNLLNNNLLEFNEIDLSSGSFVNYFYPVSNHKYLCIWDAECLINSLPKIDEIENIENLLISLSVNSTLSKFRSLCMTSILCRFQNAPVDNQRYFVSREVSELILSNYETFYNSISIITKFNI